MDQYPVSTCQRATIVAIAWMPATRTSLIVLLTCYLLIIVVLPNHRIRFNIFCQTVCCEQNYVFCWAKLCILLINWMVNCSLYRIRVTTDHNLMIFSRNTELITWHDTCILSSFLMGGPYDSGFLCNQNKDLLTISTMYLTFILWVFLVHVVCYFV